MSHVVIVIPARMASTRFPNKPQALIRGRTMIERVWRLAKAARHAQEVWVATDSEALRAEVESFGAAVVMTSPECATGTDRVAEAVERLGKKADVVFSLQGDAVLTPPWVIDEVLEAMLRDPSVQMATPAVKLSGEALHHFVQAKRAGSTSGTSVVFDSRGNALYFSKGLIPFDRSQTPSLVYRHIGLYGYRTEMLQRLSQLPESGLERIEKLEQLRALENGIPIRVVLVDYRGRTHGSVDRPEDVAVVEEIIAREGELV